MFYLGCFVGLVVGVLLTIVWLACVPPRRPALPLRGEPADPSNARFRSW